MALRGPPHEVDDESEELLEIQLLLQEDLMKVKKLKSTIAMVMAVVMTASSLTTYFPSYAAESESETETVTEVSKSETGATEGETQGESGTTETTSETAAAESDSQESVESSGNDNNTVDSGTEKKTETSDNTEAEKEAETEAPNYTVTLPYYEDADYTYDEEKLKEQAEDKSLVLEYEAGEKVEISIEPVEDILIDELHVFYSGNEEISFDWVEEDKKLTFSMPEQDVWLDVTLISAAESETESEQETESETTEEAWGWVEYDTTEGGSISASFEYYGEVFDAGTYTYDMMEYGPWEAQYETVGTITVTATADDGYVLKMITLTDEEGNEITPYDTDTVSFSADGTRKIIVTAVFAEAGSETEVETETEAESISESEVETVYNVIVSAADDIDVTLDHEDSLYAAGENVNFTVSLLETDETEKAAEIVSESENNVSETAGSEDVNEDNEAEMEIETEIETDSFNSEYETVIVIQAIRVSQNAENEEAGLDTLAYVDVSYDEETGNYYFEMPEDDIELIVYLEEEIVNTNEGIMLVDDADDETDVEAGSFYYYSDGTLHYLADNSALGYSTGDSYKYVKYKVNGKTYTAIAYCMQHSLHAPTSGSTYTSYYDLDSGGDDKYLRKAMFYGYNGPAWGVTINGRNLKSIFDKYGTQSSEYKMMMHYLVDYLYDGSSGFVSTLNDNAIEMLVELKACLTHLPDPAASSITTSKTLSAEGRQSATTNIGSSTYFSQWVFTVELEDGVSLVNVTTGTTYTDTGTVNGGDKFYFLATGNTSSLSGSYKVTCNYPLDFHAIALASSSYQDIGFGYYTTDSYITISVEWPDTGFLKLVKDSGNKDITDGNSMYDLSGATYGVYTDEACTLFATTTVENSDGTTSEIEARLTVESVSNGDGTFSYESGTVELESGTYYVKEISAGSGYLVDENVYSVSVEAEETSVVNADINGLVYEPPMVYYTDLILQKITESNTSISLAGAVFKLEFYAGATAETGTATKTWYLESDADGSVLLRESYLASGYTSSSFYTDASGTICLPLGFLKITEVKEPAGYVRSDDVVTYTLTSTGWTISRNGTAEATGTVSTAASATISNETVQKAGYIDNEPVYGGVSLDKKDAETSDGSAQGDGSLAGFTFDIISENDFSVVLSTDKSVSYSKGDVVMTLTTDENGHAESGTVIQAGTYTVVESGQNGAYTSDGTNTSYTITISEDGQVISYEVTNEVKKGGISLQKADAETGESSAQGEASLEGATFAIINASDYAVLNAEGNEIPTAKASISDTPTAAELRELAADGSYTVQTITTDANGFATTDADGDGTDDSLPYGTYYVVEIESSYGYWIDESFVGKAVVRSDGTVTALGTTDGESTFTDIYDTNDTTVDQTPRRGDLTFQKVDIDGNYKSFIPFLISAVVVDDAGNETVVESHVIVSDANGTVNTARTHSVNTNGFDQYVENGVVTAEGEALLEEASGWGVWFGSLDALNDEYGAMYTCYYRITELQCEDNSSKSENLLESDLIYIDNTTGDETEVLSASTTNTNNAELHTYHPLVDTEIVLTSTALDAESGTQTVSVKSANEVTDEVSYTHVSADHTYRMETQFVDITDGNKVLTIVGTDDADAVISDDGLWVTKEFQPEQKSGTNSTYGDITMSATLDTTGLNGHTIVAVDYLYQYVNGYWILVAKHEDYIDEDQMLYVPDLHTSAVDGQTGSRVGTKSEDDSILDTVTYSNLAKGEMYVITMQVINADTGEAIEDGKTVTSKRIYSRNDTPVSGTVEMPEFTLDSSAFDGDVTLVVVESLYRADEDGNPIGEAVLTHDSLVDEDQTIRYPDVHTSASDSLTGDDVGTSSEAATVYDEVTVTNVIFDDNDLNGQYTYTVKGTLVYQQDCTDADGVAHKAGETVETLDGTYDTVTITSDAAGNATFTYADGTTAKGTITITGYGQNVAKTAGGDAADNSYVTDSTAAVATITVELIYKVDSSKLEGNTVVVFEDLIHNDIVVASHADLTDEAQSVHYPEVKTSAADNLTTDDVGAVTENATIIDTVTLTNLVPGRSYTVSGKLVDQETGEDIVINGASVTQTAEIMVGSDGTITAANGEETTVTGYDEEHSFVSGTVALTFTFDASGLAGESVVVFEDLIHNGITVASHADLTDEDQTIHFPEIQTTAADGYTEDSVGTVSEEAVIVDTVIYTNLVPGREYTVSGVLMDKETGEQLLDADGKTVTAERTFTAGETEDGLTATVDEEANSVSGTIEITFAFDASLLAGTTTVAFEDLIHNGITVTAHCDINDEDQTIHFPDVQTSAADGTVGDEVGMTGETTIVDTVSLSNLIPGHEYTVSGVLMDKDTGAELLVDGETVTQEVKVTVNADGTVTAENGETVTDVTYDENMNSVDCTVELIYTLDASTLAGVTTVVFEDLIHNDIVVASHADITDLGQSVHFPEIHTTATDTDTSDHVGTVKEEAVIEDAVAYTNLVVGKEYTLTGTLYNRETGLPLLDEAGNTITATATFTATAESEDGCNTVTAYHEDNNSVDGIYLITFTLDSSLLAGKTVVAFESLYHNDIEVTTHADISDNDQSVYYPDIHTTALDSTTGSHVGSIWGALINFVRKALGQDTADDANEVITDTVALTNLVPGMTYVVSGKLYNVTESLETGVETPLVVNGEEITQAVTITVSEDGKSITAADGSKTSVTAYNEELNSVDGTVDLTYTLDSSKIQGIEVVVFEKLYQDVSYTPETNSDEVKDEDLVNEHCDITDEGQSVSEISIHTTAVDTTTGDHVGTVPEDGATTSIHDEVNLAGLVVGMEYTIDGVLVSLGDSDLDSGEIYYLKADGTLTDNREEAYTESLSFTAEATSEAQILNFALTSDKVQGKSLTVFENIYHNGELISSHPAGDGDGWDEEALADQTVYYPAGKTNATDSATDEHMSLADTDRMIVDRVYFENLLAGQEYSITGQLVYKEAFTDADGTSHAAGEAVTDQVTVSFTVAADLTAASYADGSTAAVDSVTATTLADGQTAISGYVSISFSADASKLAGATLVAFESFSHNDAEIFTHNDLDDLPQTIKIPEIGTTANVNGIDEAAIYNADGSYADIVITDTVSYKNLWTADELETMSEQAKYIEYSDGTTRTQDGVIYSVSEDATYVLKGVLMDKETGEALVDSNGNTYTVYSDPFTPESTDGTYDVTFTINAGDFLNEDGESTLAGKSFVVFEELYRASTKEEATEENKVAEHKDIEDTDQDIRIPDGRTHAVPDNGTNTLSVQNLSIETMETLHASEADGAHQMQSAKTNTIVDYLAYENLHGGTVYTVTGTLMVITATDADGNPTAWETAVDDEGNAITVTETLDTGIISENYEDSVSGYLPLQFTFSALNLSGKTTVVFETISRDGVDVLVHADINDEAQTVEITPYDITVEISKKDITNSEELPGAHLIVKDADGNTVDEWTSTTEPHQIVNLALGTYTLTEVTAPDGYEVAETIEFTVEDTIEIQTVTMYDSPKESTTDLTGMTKTLTSSIASAVQTGDFFRYLPAVILIVAAVALVTVLTVNRRKKK